MWAGICEAWCIGPPLWANVGAIYPPCCDQQEDAPATPISNPNDSRKTAKRHFIGNSPHGAPHGQAGEQLWSIAKSHQKRLSKLVQKSDHARFPVRIRPSFGDGSPTGRNYRTGMSGRIRIFVTVVKIRILTLGKPGGNPVGKACWHCNPLTENELRKGAFHSLTNKSEKLARKYTPRVTFSLQSCLTVRVEKL